MIDVTTKGATGNGVTDDTRAIQAAIDAAQLTNYDTVYFPTARDVYRITAPLVVSGPIKLQGAHEGVAIKGTGFAAGQFLLDIDGSIHPNLEHVAIEQLMLLSDNGVPGGIRLNETSVSGLRNVRIFSVSRGVEITGHRGHDLKFEHVEMYGVAGNAWTFDAYSGGGHHTFVGSSATKCQAGIVVDAGSTVSGIACFSCNFEICNAAIETPGSVSGLALSGCRFEKNALALDIRPSAGRVVSGLAVHGCHFESDGASQAIALGGAGGAVRGFNISANFAHSFSRSFVRLGKECGSGVVTANRINRCPAVADVARPGVLVINNESDTRKLGQQWAPPLTTPMLDKDATDLASVVALTNQLRRALISNGMAK